MKIEELSERRPEILPMTGTKLKLFKTALDLFAQRGYGDVSVRDISAAYGITVSGIYNYFKSKFENFCDSIHL